VRRRRRYGAPGGRTLGNRRVDRRAADLSRRVQDRLLDDEDLYPDEMLSDVARRLGFGELFDDAVGLTSA
jgi:hypothetical protein